MGASKTIYRTEKGVTTHNRHTPSHDDPLFIAGKALSLDKEKIHKYFPMLVGRSSKHLYLLLLLINSNPLRSVKCYVGLCLGNYTITLKNIKLLIDMGYVQAESKPRRIIVFDVWTVDRVYRITRKGVKALTAVTGF